MCGLASLRFGEAGGDDKTPVCTILIVIRFSIKSNNIGLFAFFYRSDIMNTANKNKPHISFFRGLFFLFCGLLY